MPLATLALVIAVMWLMMRSESGPADFFVGLILALGILLFLRRSYHKERAFHRAHYTVLFVASFIREMVIANFQVLRIVLSPRLRIRPGILAFRTRLKTPLGVTVLANSITLTPGTLSVDISEDSTTIFVHTLDIAHPDEVREAIRRGLEEPIQRAME
ncbi:MAG: Na+/H+ antiporter subunit E [bacterium]